MMPGQIKFISKNIPTLSLHINSQDGHGQVSHEPNAVAYLLFTLSEISSVNIEREEEHIVQSLFII